MPACLPDAYLPACLQYMDSLIVATHCCLPACLPDACLQDMGSLIVAVGSRGGRPLALTWDFLLEHMDDVLARFPNGGAAYSLGLPLRSLTDLLMDGSMQGA